MKFYFGESIDMTNVHTEKRGPKTVRRVLIVDDYPEAAEGLAKHLRQFGNEVEVAFGGFAGIGIAETFRPDVIFLDVDMPKLNGYETARRLREQPWGKNMMLIALTGWASEEYCKVGRDAGFDAQLVKSLAYSELSRLLVSFGSSIHASGSVRA